MAGRGEGVEGRGGDLVTREVGGMQGRWGGCREEITGRVNVDLGQGAGPGSSLCFSALSGWGLVVFGDLECCFQF